MIILLAALFALQEPPPISADTAARVKQQALLEGHTMAVFNLAFSPDGKTLASAGIDSTARTWDATAGKPVAKFQHSKQVLVVAFSKDGSRLVAAGYEPAVRVWDLKAGKLFEIQTPAKDSAQRFQMSTVNNAITRDGVRIGYTTDSGDQVFLWDTNAKTQREVKSPDPKQHYWRVAFNADGSRLAVQLQKSEELAVLQVWDLKEGKPLASLSGEPKAFYAGEALALSLDGGTVAAVDVHSSVIQLWDVASGMAGPALKGHQHDAQSEQLLIADLAFSPDGKLLASASYDKTLRLWEVGTGKQVASLESPEAGACAVAFSPDGRRLASADLKGKVRIWSVAAP